MTRSRNARKPHRMARPPQSQDHALANVQAPAAAEPAPETSAAQGAELRTASKASTVLSLLAAEGGATLAALAAATGWQHHTLRAFLTGLRKKGHEIEREKVEGESRYRLGAAGQA